MRHGSVSGQVHKKKDKPYYTWNRKKKTILKGKTIIIFLSTINLSLLEVIKVVELKNKKKLKRGSVSGQVKKKLNLITHETEKKVI